MLRGKLQLNNEKLDLYINKTEINMIYNLEKELIF
jgi:hypothetical protein